ncbi:unnamed protein product [Moneuplotes crassus]|uniref:Uncharacterized protein n=1 Tax=Euplotes crassus TaxID=5936 RepID=A0AAD1XFN3_EUPCR|nr:unnamed protein product [Moneuplotes crassus]
MNRAFEATGKSYGHCRDKNYQADLIAANRSFDFSGPSDTKSDLSSSRFKHHIVIPVCGEQLMPHMRNSMKSKLVSTKRVSAYEDGSMIRVQRSKKKAVSILKNYTIQKSSLIKKTQNVGTSYKVNSYTVPFKDVLESKKKFCNKIKIPTIYFKHKSQDGRRNSTKTTTNKAIKKFLPQTSALIMSIYREKKYASKRSLSTSSHSRASYGSRRTSFLNSQNFRSFQYSETLNCREPSNDSKCSTVLTSHATCPVFDKDSVTSKISRMLAKNLDHRKTKLLKPFLKKTSWIQRNHLHSPL